MAAIKRQAELVEAGTKLIAEEGGEEADAIGATPVLVRKSSGLGGGASATPHKKLRPGELADGNSAGSRDSGFDELFDEPDNPITLRAVHQILNKEDRKGASAASNQRKSQRASRPREQGRQRPS